MYNKPNVESAKTTFEGRWVLEIFCLLFYFSVSFVQGVITIYMYIFIVSQNYFITRVHCSFLKSLA